MGVTYDPTTPPVRQTDSWSCSVAAAAWMLHSIGYQETYPEPMESAEIAAGLVSPQNGLEVGSGGPLADWLGATFDLTTGHSFPVSWDWLLCYAGMRPIMIGSGSLYHWVAVRGTDGEMLTLANPAPGYKGLGDTMTEAEFNRWAPWACVWIEVEEAEDMSRVDELTSQVGWLTGDLADIFDEKLAEARAATNKAGRETAYQEIANAIATLRRGGAPA